MRDIIIAGGLGVVLGIIFYFLAVYQVSVRAGFADKDKVDIIKKKIFLVVWLVVLVGLNIILSQSKLDLFTKCSYYLMFAIMLNIAAVDILLRRIPNACLLGIMILKIVDIVVKQVWGNEFWFDSCLAAVVGLVGIYVLCTLPAVVGINMGAGDIKYCSVLGFVFGITGFAFAMGAMVIALLIYLAYLKISGKGGLKTMAPLGPFLSIGTLLPMFLLAYSII